MPGFKLTTAKTTRPVHPPIQCISLYVYYGIGTCGYRYAKLDPTFMYNYFLVFLSMPSCTFIFLCFCPCLHGNSLWCIGFSLFLVQKFAVNYVRIRSKSSENSQMDDAQRIKRKDRLITFQAFLICPSKFVKFSKLNLTACIWQLAFDSLHLTACIWKLAFDSLHYTACIWPVL